MTRRGGCGCRQRVVESRRDGRLHRGVEEGGGGGSVSWSKLN